MEVNQFDKKQIHKHSFVQFYYGQQKFCLSAFEYSTGIQWQLNANI